MTARVAERLCLHACMQRLKNMAEAKNEDVDASWIDVELASFPGLLGDEANVELDVEAKDEIEGLSR